MCTLFRYPPCLNCIVTLSYDIQKSQAAQLRSPVLTATGLVEMGTFHFPPHLHKIDVVGGRWRQWSARRVRLSAELTCRRTAVPTCARTRRRRLHSVGFLPRLWCWRRRCRLPCGAPRWWWGAVLGHHIRRPRAFLGWWVPCTTNCSFERAFDGRDELYFRCIGTSSRPKTRS